MATEADGAWYHALRPMVSQPVDHGSSRCPDDPTMPPMIHCARYEGPNNSDYRPGNTHDRLTADPFGAQGNMAMEHGGGCWRKRLWLVDLGGCFSFYSMLD